MQFYRKTLDELFSQKHLDSKSLFSTISKLFEYSSNFDNKSNDIIYSHLQKSLEKSNDVNRTANIMSVICMIIKMYPQLALEHWLPLIHPEHSDLLRRLESDENPMNNKLKLNMIQCLEVVFTKAESKELTSSEKKVCERIMQMILRMHYSTSFPIGEESMDLTLFLLSSVNLLQRLVNHCPAYAREVTSELLGIAETYMTYGIDPFTMPQVVRVARQPHYETDNELSQPRCISGKMSKSRKLRVAKSSSQNQGGNSMQSGPKEGAEDEAVYEINSCEKASEQENSEQSEQKSHVHAQSVRYASVALIDVIVRIQERRVVYSFWCSLFPSGNDVLSRNLLRVAREDPNGRCRTLALQVAAHIIFVAKPFLLQADESNKRCTSAFLPFSHNLGMSILATYDNLTSILSSETSFSVLIQALKCLAVLVQATPFHRFKSGNFVVNFVNHVKPLVYHRDATIQVSALLVLEFLISAPDRSREIQQAIGLPAVQSKAFNKKLFNKINYVVALDGLNESIETDGSEQKKEITAVEQKFHCNNSSSNFWLLERVLGNLEYGKVKTPTPVRLASYQVLSAMAIDFPLIDNHLTLIANLLKNSLLDPVCDVRLYAARCLDTYSHQISMNLLKENASFTDSNLGPYGEFWNILLPVITQLLGEDSNQLPSLKISLCDSLSNMGSDVFDRLSHYERINLLSFLSGLSSCEKTEFTVRAAAVRVMAVFVLFPSLKSDFVFLENVAELALPLAKDTNPAVRNKASWSIANISDAIASNAENCKSSLAERPSIDLLQRLINVASDACNDNDKVRCNAVRTLGNLLGLLRIQDLDSIVWRELFQKAINKIIGCLKSTGNAKMKWNSCYAIGNFLRNQALFLATEKYTDLDWQDALYKSLCHLIMHHENFKVRTNATLAIVQVENRLWFNSSFEMIWHSLLVGIERSHNLDNFYEYNHRDNLQEQLCLAISHMIRLASDQDFSMLRRHVAERSDMVRNTWMRIANRIVPERAAALLACSAFLQNRLERDQITAEQRSALTMLLNIFIVL